MTHVPTDHEVETFTGKFVDVEKPDPATICVEDIAHALANTCRYGGHCQDFYSVAEHVVFVSYRLERKYGRVALSMLGLHHDDPEYVLQDIPRPLKPLLGNKYVMLTRRMEAAVRVALSLPPESAADHTLIKDADNWSLFVEARYLLPSQGKHWWDGLQGARNWEIGDMPSRIIVPDYWRGGLNPADAEAVYLQRHRELLLKAQGLR